MTKDDVLEHNPGLVHQWVSDVRGEWVYRRLTGLAHLCCNCGYSSGWVPVESLPDPDVFYAEHSPLIIMGDA